jgi:hypothetical protein
VEWSKLWELLLCNLHIGTPYAFEETRFINNQWYFSNFSCSRKLVAFYVGIPPISLTATGFSLPVSRPFPNLHNMMSREVNSLTAKSCYGGEKHRNPVGFYSRNSTYGGEKHRNPVGFYSRNSTKSTLQHKHNCHIHHHHGGAVCPSFGVGSMDPPDRTCVTSSEGVGRGGGGSG